MLPEYFLHLKDNLHPSGQAWTLEEAKYITADFETVWKALENISNYIHREKNCLCYFNGNDYQCSRIYVKTTKDKVLGLL